MSHIYFQEMINFYKVMFKILIKSQPVICGQACISERNCVASRSVLLAGVENVWMIVCTIFCIFTAGTVNFTEKELVSLFTFTGVKSMKEFMADANLLRHCG